MSKRRSIATLSVMGATLMTRIFGFVKFAVISNYLGGQGAADVVNAVFAIPNNLRKLMAEGALTTAFIPALSGQVVHGHYNKAQRITQQVLALQYAILLPFIIITMIASPWVVRVFVQFSDTEKMILAGTLYKLFIPYVALVSISAIMVAVLNTHHRFLLGALSPLFFSLAIIGSIILLHDSIGVYSMAVGVLAGGFVQIAVLYPLFTKLGYNLLPIGGWRDPEFKDLVKKWLPALATSSVFAINQQVAMLLASRLSDGSSSALANAVVFFQLPFGVFSAAINTVFFPQMAQMAKLNDHKGLQESTLSGIHLLLIFLVPSGLLMALLSEPIIGVAFLRGAFTVGNVQLAAAVLVGFCVGMFFTAGYNFIQRYFYAQGWFRLPLFTAIFACSADIVISLLLISHLGVVGLAYANSIAFFIALMVLLVLTKRTAAPLHFGQTFILLVKLAVAQTLGWAVYLINRHFFGVEWWMDNTALGRNFSLLSWFGLSSLVAIFGTYRILGVNFLSDLKRKRVLNEKCC